LKFLCTPLRINVLYCSDTSELLNIQAEGVRKIL